MLRKTILQVMALAYLATTSAAVPVDDTTINPVESLLARALNSSESGVASNLGPRGQQGDWVFCYCPGDMSQFTADVNEAVLKITDSTSLTRPSNNQIHATPSDPQWQSSTDGDVVAFVCSWGDNVGIAPVQYINLVQNFVSEACGSWVMGAAYMGNDGLDLTMGYSFGPFSELLCSLFTPSGFDAAAPNDWKRLDITNNWISPPGQRIC